MSYIGKSPIKIPNNVNIDIVDNYIVVQGQLGIIINNVPNDLNITQENNLLYINLKNNNIVNNKKTYSMWGTCRSLINNAIIGVTRGYIVKLKMIGIGYKASMSKSYLRLKIGYTNVVKINIPSDIKIKCVRNNIIYIYGFDLQRVKQMSMLIRSYKKPDIYKGKGIQLYNEVLNLKQGKKKK